jgi:hypothetical protein
MDLSGYTCREQGQKKKSQFRRLCSKPRPEVMAACPHGGVGGGILVNSPPASVS